MNKIRLPEIDFARGVAIAILIFGHANLVINPNSLFGEGLWGTYPVIEDEYSFLVRATTTVMSMLFFLLAGMVLGINKYRNEHDGLPLIELRWRGFKLILIQLTVISLGWWLLYPTAVWYWTIGVLAAFGIGFIGLHYLRRFHHWALGGAGVLMLVIREWFPVAYDASWNIVDVTIRTLFIPGNIGNTAFWYYPAYSWLAILMIGYALGYWYYQLNREGKFSLPLAWVSSLSLFVAWLVLRLYLEIGNFNHNSFAGLIEMFVPSKYPPSVSFTMLNLSVSLSFILIGRHAIPQYLGGWITELGRWSLWIYSIHLFFLAIYVYWILPWLPVDLEQVPQVFIVTLGATVFAGVCAYYTRAVFTLAQSVWSRVMSSLRRVLK